VLFVDLATSDGAPATAQLSIVTGVYPPRAADANPAFAPGQPFDDASWRMAVYDDVAIGWMVDDGGVGFQIATTDLSQGNLDVLGTLLERLALLSASGQSSTQTDSTSTLFVTIPPQTSTTSLLVDPQVPMPDAYVQVVSMLPGNAWHAVAVQPGDPMMLTAFDVGGRQLSASYVESADPTSELPPMTLPATEGFGFIQPDGSVVVQSADGDGVVVSCQLIADTSTSDCAPTDGLPSLTLADLTQVGRDLLPLLRQGLTGPLGSLVDQRSITVDGVAAEARYRDELGADDGEFLIVPGVTTEMSPGEPNVFRAPSGSSVVTIVVDGVLFQRHEHAGVPTEQVAAAMRLMSEYVTDVGAAIVTTTTLAQP
jgi:hypothetical protein